MKKLLSLKFLLFLLALIWFSNSGAQNPCNATWTKQKDPNSALKYYFMANLNDTNYRYIWTFGDGTGSDARVTFHTFPHTGAYIVCLKVTKKDTTCTQTFCDTIVFGSNITCNAAWTKQKDPAITLKYYFSATLNDTNYRYLWTFGDGTGSDARLTFRNYAHTGKYYVCLKVMKKDSSCQQTKCDSIKVGTICTASFTRIASNTLARTYSFEANTSDTNYIYKYTFGDGSAATYGRFKTHTYANNGTYTVCLTVTRKDSSCAETQCQTIKIDTHSPCNANFNIIKSDSIGSNPHYVRFADVSPGTHTRCVYNFGDGTSSDNCNPIHYFASLDSKTICLTIYNINSNKDTLCKSTTCKTFNTGNNKSITCVAVFDYERIGTSSNYRFINHSLGSPLQYRWVFDGGAPVTTTNAEHNFVTPGLHLACLYVVNTLDTNCSSSFCVNILFPGNVTQQQCNADYSYTPDATNPGNFEFTSFSGSGVINNWNFGDGSYSNDESGQHTYLQNGTYSVCLSVLNSIDSCSDMHCDSIVVSNATGVKTNQISIGSIYPIPVEQVLQIDLQSKISQPACLRLIDVTGKIIFEENTQLQKGINPLKLDMVQYPQGIYLLQIQSGNEQIVRKIVK